MNPDRLNRPDTRWTRRRLLGTALWGSLAAGAAALASACARPLARAESALPDPPAEPAKENGENEMFTISKTDEQWRQELTPEEYDVLRGHGTEWAFTGAYWDNHAKGSYLCAACGQELFDSDTKFDSGTGWPSFYAPVVEQAVGTSLDNSMGQRIEVHCARCGGHLGHVFRDGPEPTGLRYCINSVSLDLRAEE
jgi:peptide-methionine (R)-S-oxide reductase